jgi:uroporphyrinogen decarboxylase
MLDCKPDAFHSIDPQGGMDLKYLKQYCGDRVCLIGNVNCGLLQTGTEDEVREDVLRSLRDGMPGYGYIFSTSNCIYTGLPLERYELMHRLWREHGQY